MRKRIERLIHELGLDIAVVALPAGHYGAWNSMEETIEVAPFCRDNWMVLLHETCHALQYLNESKVWLQFCIAPDQYITELEVDCELRAIGWLHLNGYSVEEYVAFANDNLSNYGVQL